MELHMGAFGPADELTYGTHGCHVPRMLINLRIPMRIYKRQGARTRGLDTPGRVVGSLDKVALLVGILFDQ